jgi:hypothetical protein
MGTLSTLVLCVPKLVKIKIILLKVQIDQSNLNNIEIISNVISRTAEKFYSNSVVPINGPLNAFHSTLILLFGGWGIDIIRGSAELDRTVLKIIGSDHCFRSES